MASEQTFVSQTINFRISCHHCSVLEERNANLQEWIDRFLLKEEPSEAYYRGKDHVLLAFKQLLGDEVYGALKPLLPFTSGRYEKPDRTRAFDEETR